MKLLNTYFAFSIVFSVSARTIENQVGPQRLTDSRPRAFEEIKNVVAPSLPSNETSKVALEMTRYTAAEATDARAVDFSERSLSEHRARGIDDAERGAWTLKTVGDARGQHPDYNAIVVDTKHTVKWEGIEYVDWVQEDVEYNSITGGTLRYKLYLGKVGDFVLEGDGGYINWAFTGNYQRQADNDKHVIFSAP